MPATQLETYIEIKHQWEGFHAWDGAPNAQKFLSYPHRHKFHAEVVLEVKHDNRELEFFEVLGFIQAEVQPVLDDLELNTSCEQMAKVLLHNLLEQYGYDRWIRVKVLEDNENGAIVMRGSDE